MKIETEKINMVYPEKTTTRLFFTDTGRIGKAGHSVNGGGITVWPSESVIEAFVRLDKEMVFRPFEVGSNLKGLMKRHINRLTKLAKDSGSQ